MLESLVRLAEARAKMELRETVTGQDALDALDVVKETVAFDTLADIMGGVGAPAVQPWGRPAGSGKGARPSAARVLNAFSSQLDYEAHKKESAFFTLAELKSAFESTGLPCRRNNFEDLIDEMNMKNYILKKGPGKYQLQGAAVTSRGQG